MGRSRPFDLCAIFKQLHEQNKRYGGRPYIITGRDLKSAKEVTDLNDWEELLSVIEPCFQSFIQSDFDGWREQGHPAWGLFTQWGRYLPKTKPKPREMMIECSLCEQVHPASQKCHVEESK
jgi:hypothetical protein